MLKFLLKKNVMVLIVHFVLSSNQRIFRVNIALIEFNSCSEKPSSVSKSGKSIKMPIPSANAANNPKTKIK